MLTLTRCQDHILTENIWFVWSKTSYSGDKRRCHYVGRTTTTMNKQRTEDRAAQPMEAGGWVSQKKDEGSVLNVLSFQLLLHGFSSPDKWHWHHHSLLDCQQPATKLQSPIWQIYNTSLQYPKVCKISESPNHSHFKEDLITPPSSRSKKSSLSSWHPSLLTQQCMVVPSYTVQYIFPLRPKSVVFD